MQGCWGPTELISSQFPLLGSKDLQGYFLVCDYGRQTEIELVTIGQFDVYQRKQSLWLVLEGKGRLKAKCFVNVQSIYFLGCPLQLL